jgi:hypothetical protein
LNAPATDPYAPVDGQQMVIISFSLLLKSTLEVLLLTLLFIMEKINPPIQDGITNGS